jgi:hypothetical protein
MRRPIEYWPDSGNNERPRVSCNGVTIISCCLNSNVNSNAAFAQHPITAVNFVTNSSIKHGGWNVCSLT